jgi:hypothetical protein
VTRDRPGGLPPDAVDHGGGWWSHEPGPPVDPRTSGTTRPTVVELSPEYGYDLPLSVDGSYDHLHISDELYERLAGWQAQFEIFDPSNPDSGDWVAVRDAWAATGRALLEELRRVVPADIDVVLDLWPIEPREADDRG